MWGEESCLFLSLLYEYLLLSSEEKPNSGCVSMTVLLCCAGEGSDGNAKEKRKETIVPQEGVSFSIRKKCQKLTWNMVMLRKENTRGGTRDSRRVAGQNVHTFAYPERTLTFFL